MLNWWGIGEAYKESPAIGWTLVTFGIFAGLLFKFVKKPAAVYLQERSDHIKTAIEEAQVAKHDAALKLQQYERRLLDLDSEISKMKSEFAHQGELERARLQEEAEKIAELIRKESEETLKAEVVKALIKLKQEIAQKILAKAAEHLHMDSQKSEQRYADFAGDIGCEVSV